MPPPFPNAAPAPDAMPTDPMAGGGPALDMAVIQIPNEVLSQIAQVLPQLTELIVAAAEKAGSDIAAQKGAVVEEAIVDQNSPDALAAEISKMRG